MKGNAVPPRVLEWLLLTSLRRGALRDCIAGELREEYAVLASGSRARATRWYAWQLPGIALRSVRDRVRGHGPFVMRDGARAPRRRVELSRMVSALRFAAKGLARAPQFTIAAALTLALAIGANTAIFSVVQGVLLKPLEYVDADRLVVIRHTAPGLGYNDFQSSPGLYLLYRRGSTAFSGSGLHIETDVNITGGDAAPERLAAVRASRDVFSTLGVTPGLGRFFDEQEDAPGGPDAVVLSHGLWQERFGGDASIVGRSVTIDGAEHTVIGVMPARFAFPDRDVRLWLPLALDTTATDYGNFSFDVIARLRPGVAGVQAETELKPLLERIREEPGEGSDFVAFMDAGNLAPVVRSLKESVVGDVSRALWILLGTVAFVFLIACANVTNLFLVRAEARQKEMAVRAAMGARRGSLIGYYAAESLVIASLGGLLGLGLAWAGLRALIAAAPPNIPRLHEVAIDPMVLIFAVAVTVLAAVLLGLLPALRLTAPDLLATLGRSTRGMSASRERNRARQALVIAQTALALVLLVGTGLMVRSFQNMRSIDIGFEQQNAVTFRISLPESTYPDGAAVARFHRDLLDRLREVPGVESAGATTHAPLAGCCSGTAHQVEGQAVEPGQMPPMFWYSTVSDGYFETMRIRLVAGRFIDTAERTDDPRSIVVSEALAKRVWPDADPLGRQISLASDSGWFTVVGVAGNVHDRALEDSPSEMVYYPVGAATGQARTMTYVLRTARGADIYPLAREAVWSVDATLPIAQTTTYAKIVDDSMVRISFTMLALLAASAVALILGAIGLYSVISYLVTQRTNEIGIRLALGARPTQVRTMVVMQGARLAVVGLVAGIAAALALTRLMRGMLYGTEPDDPVTFVLVSVFLGGITALAAWVPAYRASRIDPATSLKVE